MTDLQVKLMTFSYLGHNIPSKMWSGIEAYVKHGQMPGGFLRAVFSNNLKDAIFYADPENIHLLPVYVMFFQENIPWNCWGSEERVRTWCLMFEDGIN